MLGWGRGFRIFVFVSLSFFDAGRPLRVLEGSGNLATACNWFIAQLITLLSPFRRVISGV